MDSKFPDEIFLKLFRYLPRLDLYRGFYNLNSRLNGIISESRVYFRSRLSKEEQSYILPYVHPKQIRAFCVCKEKYNYSKLDQCVDIRELEFSCGGNYNIYSYVEPQLICVQPSIFPRLKKLIIYVHSGSPAYINLCVMIFNNQFPVLESVLLPYATAGSCLSRIKTWSTCLKYVWIQCCNKSIFYPLLDNLPNLKSFTCTLGTQGNGSLKNQCLSLTNLSLETYDRTPTPDGYQQNSMMSFDEMIDLYKCFPNLEETNLYVFNPGSLETKIDYLNRILSQCPKLKSFDCFIAYYGANSTSIDEIKKRYPLFETCSAGTWPTRRIYECRIRK